MPLKAGDALRRLRTPSRLVQLAELAQLARLDELGERPDVWAEMNTVMAGAIQKKATQGGKRGVMVLRDPAAGS